MVSELYDVVCVPSSGLRSSCAFRACQLELNLERLRAAVDTLLVEMSRFFPKQKQRTIFLINNYDLILAVFKVTCFRLLWQLLPRSTIRMALGVSSLS